MACDLATIKAASCLSGIGKEQSRIKLLQLIAQLTCEASEGAGGAVWGEITGDIANQTDLQAALDQRARVLTYAQNTPVAGTGSSPFTLWSQAIPGGAMGPNGFIRCTYIATCNNDASVKQLGAYLNSTVIWSSTMTSTATIYGHLWVFNRNAQNSQLMRPALDNNTVNGATTTAPFAVAVDTSANFTFELRAVLSDVADTITLQTAFLEVFYLP